ncbi:MAG: VTT domain-containing protein [Anaerolineae bacterium]|nr:VTT domain-containing protein [Chloroflexota bacterium]
MSSLGSAEAPATTRSGHRSRIVALLASVTITALVWVFRDQLVQLERYGYLGVFLVSILSNATVVLPAPGLAVVFAGGSVLNPLLVGLVAGIGEPIGELTGYMAGYAGSAVIEDHARFQQIASLLERHGFLTLFLLSLIPNPVFDLAGIAAGMARIPIGRFLLPCWLGKTGKAILVALLGSVSLEWFLGIMG